MNEKHLHETLEQVINLIPRLSWEIMDEAQKDELMSGIVMSRWNAVTSDGTKLGASTWAAILGTTPRAVESRQYRLRQQQSETAADDTSARSRQKDIAAARRVLADPEARGVLVESMPIEAKVDVAKSLAQTPASAPISGKRIQDGKAAVAPLERAVSSFAAVLGTVSLIDRATAEINEAVGKSGLNPDALRQIEEAIDRLNGALDFAKSMAGEAAA